ncbi:MAG: redox-sensing transcriptional repressor Rex, partial [Lentisphaeria bacterium]|nr:redox-sensing transcriptional repressor Rex [Lentisphaeria bacterium]
IRYIKQYLGWEQVISATLIGAGALGTALLGYDDFTSYGLNIESVFDRDPMKVGHEIRGREVYDISTLESRLQLAPPQIAIICVGNSAAQQVADRLINVGVKYIWNFANVSLKTPPGVIVQREVIAGGFALLSVKLKMSRSGEAGIERVQEE